MSSIPRICAKCNRATKNEICEFCGYDLDKEERKVDVVEKEDRELLKEKQNAMWESWETTIMIVGNHAWQWGIVCGIIFLIIGIYSSSLWEILSSLIIILISIIWIKDNYSKFFKEGDIEGLLNYDLILFSLRIPWMLIMGLILSIFGDFWMAIPVLIPALIIIFVGPGAPYDWKTSEESNVKEYLP